MSERIYKQYQALYAAMVQEHSDDFSKMSWVEHPELIENAIKYFKDQSFPLIYPAKSYAVAIIYATLIEQHYGFALRDVLDDEDLFLGNDDFFVPYSKDPITYEAILERLSEMPDWINSGWAPKTAHYFYLECTEDGINEVTNQFEAREINESY